ncbi:hypothetical protein KASHIRA_00180 [Serratia phage vB_SmaM-Kashira]|nr:hypothetical protein KASHIRA_00180 [Serratia phage vB_SmaM-Kashira]
MKDYRRTKRSDNSPVEYMMGTGEICMVIHADGKTNIMTDADRVVISTKYAAVALRNMLNDAYSRGELGVEPEKKVSVFCEWDIGQENLVFNSKEEAKQWLIDNTNLEECYEEGLEGVEAVDDLIGAGLVGFTELTGGH